MDSGRYPTLTEKLGVELALELADVGNFSKKHKERLWDYKLNFSVKVGKKS